MMGEKTQKQKEMKKKIQSITKNKKRHPFQILKKKGEKEEKSRINMDV